MDKEQLPGRQVHADLKGWRLDRYESSRHTGWMERIFEVSSSSSECVPGPSNEPALGFGNPPFSSEKSAVAEWIWGDKKTNDVPYFGRMLVILPDTRGRIVVADWASEDTVRVELEMNVPAAELELQILLEGNSTERHRLFRGPGKDLSIDVPKGTETARLYLVNAQGERLSQASLSTWSRKLDIRSEKPTFEKQAEIDLAGGENDEVEFKPFIEPKHPKERELMVTVVAFANTKGGRLYLGLDDHRGVQGTSELKRMYKGAEETARDSLIKYVRKLLGDKIRPVPKFSINFIEHRGEPVAVVSIERGEQPPYATDTDEVYVRKGSSNVRPDPLTELRDLCMNRKKEGYLADPITAYANVLNSRLF